MTLDYNLLRVGRTVEDMQQFLHQLGRRDICHGIHNIESNHYLEFLNNVAYYAHERNYDNVLTKDWRAIFYVIEGKEVVNFCFYHTYSDFRNTSALYEGGGVLVFRTLIRRFCTSYFDWHAQQNKYHPETHPIALTRDMINERFEYYQANNMYK